MASPYFVLLVEDKAHDLFVYRLLLHWGVVRQRIRVRPYPSDGTGSGEQHVREQLPGNLAAVRRAASAHCLIAMTDADHLTVAERRGQLNDELARASVSPPSGYEGFVLIPRRHVEAWLHFLEAREIDEVGRFEQAFRTRLAAACKEAAICIDAWLLGTAEGPPSLLAARNDFLALRNLAKS